jgi:hypothetical protein
MPPFDLTGGWSGDDGGWYFIRQFGRSVTWTGLHNSGFHWGIEFANVFQGQISADDTTLSGEWADVPRGGTNNAGTISLRIVRDSLGLPRQLDRIAAGTTGGFGGTVLTGGEYTRPFQDIVSVENEVQRYDVPLAQNNPPCRDFSVLWGWIGNTTGPTLPPPPGDYCSFICGGWPGDGDFSFDLQPDFSMLEPSFWTDRWVSHTFLVPGEDNLTGAYVQSNEHILILYDSFKKRGFHCEAAMYARKNDCSSCHGPFVFLLPGWNEQSGNSVLVNGHPINGNLNHGPETSSPLSFNLGPGGKQVIPLTTGAYARVTGVVADDHGHEDAVPPEIHPLYAIDIIQDFAATRGGPVQRPVVGGPNLTGAWHGNDIGTYYIRQIGDIVWWLGLSCDQGRGFTNVFRGTLTDGILHGAWVDVPLYGGQLGSGSMTIYCGSALATELIKISTNDVFGATRWTKLYDTPPGGPPVTENA